MVKFFIATLVTVFVASPAKADDWALTCNYAGGAFIEIKYNAGDPSHSIAVKRKGSTGLQVTSAVPAARLTAPGNYIFMVDREQAGKPNEHSLLVRLNTETMVSTLEAGNGVSWDYLNLKGKCVEQ